MNHTNIEQHSVLSGFGLFFLLRYLMYVFLVLINSFTKFTHLQNPKSFSVFLLHPFSVFQQYDLYMTSGILS